MAPCRSFELSRRFGGTYRLHLRGRKIRERGTSVSRWLQIFFTLNMEAIRSSETSVHFTRSTRRHIPEDGILHSHRSENLKSSNLFYTTGVCFDQHWSSSGVSNCWWVCCASVGKLNFWGTPSSMRPCVLWWWVVPLIIFSSFTCELFALKHMQ
jgi:hypothetical protein